MHPVLERMTKFSDAEDFLAYLGVEHDPAVVSVNRLHILKRFQQYLRAAPPADDESEAAALASCRSMLERAYADFVRSSAVQERVFKVFDDVSGIRTVGLDALRATLPSRSSPSAANPSATRQLPARSRPQEINR